MVAVHRHADGARRALGDGAGVVRRPGLDRADVAGSPPARELPSQEPDRHVGLAAAGQATRSPGRRGCGDATGRAAACGTVRSQTSWTRTTSPEAKAASSPLSASRTTRRPDAVDAAAPCPCGSCRRPGRARRRGRRARRRPPSGRAAARKPMRLELAVGGLEPVDDLVQQRQPVDGLARLDQQRGRGQAVGLRQVGGLDVDVDAHAERDGRRAADGRLQLGDHARRTWRRRSPRRWASAPAPRTGSASATAIAATSVSGARASGGVCGRSSSEQSRHVPGGATQRAALAPAARGLELRDGQEALRRAGRRGAADDVLGRRAVGQEGRELAEALARGRGGGIGHLATIPRPDARSLPPPRPRHQPVRSAR